MAAFEIIDDQIVIKSFQETREEIRADWRKTFEGIDLSPTTVDGHHVDLEANVVTSSMQALQSVVTNLDRRYAKGSFLDVLAAFLGLTRLPSTVANPTIKFVGTAGTVIPQGSTVTYEGSLYNFTTDEELTISSSGSVYGTVTCEVSGFIDLFVGKWIFVSTSPSGITCFCESKAGAGRDDETDAELFARMNDADNSGLATLPGMRTYLRNRIATNVDVIANDEDMTVDGLPPHRFRVSVPAGAGPSANEIAQAIYESKPAGIKSFGNQSGTAVDPTSGQSFTEYYSVPSPVSAYVRVAITGYSEETIPANAEEAIKDAIVAWAKSEFASGRDVIAVRFFAPILTVQGIYGIVVQVSKNGSTWSDTSVSIGSEEYASVDRNNIQVTIGG